MNTGSHPILFFDGECNLCNSAVQFIIRHDKKKVFRFAPLQSEAGKEALKRYSGVVPDSVILLYNDTYFIKSAAALQTLRLLGGAWRVFYAGIVIPRFFRDWLYDFVSKNRYKWFGKRDVCMIPTPQLMDRFLSK